MATVLFVVLVGGLIIERLLELRASKNNTLHLLKIGGRLHGNKHYRVIVLMHVCFFASIIYEQSSSHELPYFSDQWPLFLVIFIAAQLLRLFSRKALAGRWTTQIVTVDGERLVSSGPYRYIRHPIYLAVALELFSLPMIFALWMTAFVFTIWNAIMLFGFRIPAENRALSEV